MPPPLVVTDAVTASLGFTSHRFVVRVVPTDLQTYDGVDAPLHGARGAHETVAAAVIKADAPPDASATGPGADLRANINKNRNDCLDFFLSVARLRLGFGPSKG